MLGDGEPQDGHLDFHTVPELGGVRVQCSFTFHRDRTDYSRDRDPQDIEHRTATLTFTQLPP